MSDDESQSGKRLGGWSQWELSNQGNGGGIVDVITAAIPIGPGSLETAVKYLIFSWNSKPEGEDRVEGYLMSLFSSLSPLCP